MAASRAGARAFAQTFVDGLPDRVRFEVRRFTRPRFFAFVDAPRNEYALAEWRWSCPDPDYDWHRSVEDQGWADTPDEAHDLLVEHWKLHHSMWPADYTLICDGCGRHLPCRHCGEGGEQDA